MKIYNIKFAFGVICLLCMNILVPQTEAVTIINTIRTESKTGGHVVVSGGSGVDGTRGEDGQDGANGKNGKDGEDGKDGADSVVQNGNEIASQAVSVSLNEEFTDKSKVVVLNQYLDTTKEPAVVVSTATSTYINLNNDGNDFEFIQQKEQGQDTVPVMQMEVLLNSIRNFFSLYVSSIFVR
jgi:hypothetical protein